MRWQSLCFSVVVFIFLPAAAWAQSCSAAVGFDLLYDTPIFDSCSGEVVNFAGSIHTDATSCSDAHGGKHVMMHENYSNVRGIGQTTGYSYVLVSDTFATLNFPSSGAADLTFIDTVNMISQGSLPNDRLLMTFHVTINSLGQLSVFIDSTVQTCH